MPLKEISNIGLEKQTFHIGAGYFSDSRMIALCHLVKYATHSLYRMGTATAGVLSAATFASHHGRWQSHTSAGARLLDLIYCKTETS